MPEDDYLALSGIQHFAYCRRQWALIHIERQWNENLFTAEGLIMHQRAHDESIRERRGDVIVVRGLRVHSHRLKLTGACDVVEFHSDKQGHPLDGEDGLWRPFPVEYKRGRAKLCDEDRLQLCAQAMCLEEMLGCDIPEGALYYGETHSREGVSFGDGLREETAAAAREMHDLFRRGRTPVVRRSRRCRACSLAERCMPEPSSARRVESYLQSYLGEE